MKMNSQEYEQVKGLKIDKYKRMCVKKCGVCSLHAETWCMDYHRSVDCRMKEYYEFFQEYLEQRQ